MRSNVQRDVMFAPDVRRLPPETSQEMSLAAGVLWERE